MPRRTATNSFKKFMISDRNDEKSWVKIELKTGFYY